MSNQIENEMTLEEMFAQIESVIKELENPEIAIEDAFTKYQNGMNLLKGCNDKIDAIEKKVIMISENGETDEFKQSAE